MSKGAEFLFDFSFHYPPPLPPPIPAGQALMAYVLEALRGVKGFVTDEAGNALGGMRMQIRDREFAFKTTPLGEFWRILLDGSYTLQVPTSLYPT